VRLQHYAWAAFAALATLCLLAVPASAHVAGGVAGGFQSGLLHPVLGFDHLLAMFAVGLWGAQIGGRSLWVLPAVFPMIMALGGIVGIAGVPLPAVEPAIALSAIVLGLAILAAWKAPEWLAVVLVGGFAIFHGYAHGAELPGAADPIAYSVGFVIATGLIHLAGIAFGMLLNTPFQGWIARAGGGFIGLAGVYFLLG